MGLKKYLIASIILIALVAGFIYSLDLGVYTLAVDTGIKNIAFSQELPIYIWITVPTIILFIASVLHIIFYGSKGYFQRKAQISDVHTLEDIIKDRILNHSSNKRIKTDEFRELADILNKLEIDINDKFECKNSKLNETIDAVNDIHNNKFVSSKTLKLEETNKLAIKNIQNRIDEDSNFAFEVLKSPSKYDAKIIEYAFYNVIENKSLDKIKQVIENITMTNKMVATLLLKDSNAPIEQRFTNSEILSYIQNNKLTNKELISIAKNYKRTMQPEQLIKLYEDISANDESLTQSYLYVLFEYEMKDKIKDILVNSQEDEYQIFKALIDLKDCGKHYNVESLLL